MSISKQEFNDHFFKVNEILIEENLAGVQVIKTTQKAVVSNLFISGLGKEIKKHRKIEKKMKAMLIKNDIDSF